MKKPLLSLLSVLCYLISEIKMAPEKKVSHLLTSDLKDIFLSRI